MSPQPPSTSLQCDGGLASWQLGPPSPPLLALHGFLGSGADFHDLSQRLGRRILAADLPGHGQSPWTDDNGRPAATFEAALPLLDAWAASQAPGALPLLGYSLGGRTALLWALERPQRVQCLVLIGACPGLNTEDERGARRSADEDLAQRLEWEGGEAFLEAWAQRPIIRSQTRIPAAISEGLRRRRLEQDPRGWAASLRGMGTGSMPSLWDRLGDLDCPVLLLTGEEDAKFGDLAETMIQHLPDARHERIAGAGHCAHLEQAEATARAIEGFLESVEASP